MTATVPESVFRLAREIEKDNRNGPPVENIKACN